MSGLKDELTSSFISKLGGALIKPSLRKFKSRFDYKEHGGAPLLGVKAPVIKAHGSSNDIAIKMQYDKLKYFAKAELNWPNKKKRIMRR